jgi:PAB1-binding protein PBP1
MTNLGKVDDKARKSTLSDVLENTSSTDITAFQTDSDIAASSGIAQRDLKRWVPDGPEPQAQQNGNGNARASRDSETFGNATTGTWDQFETHKRLFGGESTYDENLYTTKLDKSGPDYKKREKEAERLAKEIMGVSV